MIIRIILFGRTPLDLTILETLFAHVGIVIFSIFSYIFRKPGEHLECIGGFLIRKFNLRKNKW